MGHGADPGAAPPRRLGVGRHADRPGHVRGPAVTGLHQPVIVAGREEEDRLAARGLHHLAHVAHHQRAPGQAAEVHGLEVGEQGVVALDRHHGLVRRHLVALVQRAHLQLVPAELPAAAGIAPAGALAQDRDRLVDAAQHRFALLKDLRRDAWVQVLGLEQLLGLVEVRVAVVPVADPVDRQAEDLGLEAGTALGRYAAPSTLRISASAARAHLELLAARLARSHHALDLVARLAQQAREPRAVVSLRPREHLDGHGGAAHRHAGLRQRSAQAGAAGGHVAHGGGPEHRRHEVGSAAVVLLVRCLSVTAGLVGRDRLVLDAVVGGEVAAAQGQQGGGQADQPDRGLAAHRSRAGGTDRLAKQGGAGHRTEGAHVLHRQLRGRHRALHERDHRHRLRELGHAAHTGDSLGGPAAEVGLAPAGHLDLSGPGANGCRPVGGPVNEQPVA